MPLLARLRSSAHWLVPATLAMLLGLWGLESNGLWLDERITMEAGTINPFMYPWEVPFFPYYLAVWIWSLGGLLDFDGWLRLSSVLAMVVGVVFTSLLGKRLGGRRLGMAAGIILALAPSTNRFNQELRNYAVAVALTAIITWAFYERFKFNQRRAQWVFGIGLFLLPFMAPYALIVVPGLLVLALLDPGLRARLRSMLPWSMMLVPGVLAQIYAAVLIAHYFHDAIVVPELTQFAEPLLWPMAYSTGPDWHVVTAGTFGVIALVLGVLTRSGVMWILAVAAGAISLFAVSFLGISFWLVRAAIPLSPWLALAAGFAVVSLPWLRYWLVLGLLTAVSLPTIAELREPGARDEDVKAAVPIVESQYTDGDTVYVVDSETFGLNWLSWGLQRYGQANREYETGSTSTGRTWVWSKDAKGARCDALDEWRVGAGVLQLCPKWP